jgi:uncharacterized Fe-S cluster-containing MiaB family protein
LPALQIERASVEHPNHDMSLTDSTGHYPEQAADRARWILARRGARNLLDPLKPYAFLAEIERAGTGEVVSVATIFLTNRECPWHCLMCDLWRNSLVESVPDGAIPAQIDYALAELAKQHSAGLQPASSNVNAAADSDRTRRTEEEASALGSPLSSPGVGLPSMMRALRQIKLYNSGSFFDPRAIPPEDYPAIADRLREFERVIVECHPALVGEAALEFRNLLEATEVRQTGRPHDQPASGISMNIPLSPSLSPAPSGGEGWGEGVRSWSQCMREAEWRLSRSRRFGVPALAGPDRLEEGHQTSGHAQKLEVAMGLETAHPKVLQKLNKGMSLDQFRRAAEFLRAHEIALRVFVLVKPPFLGETEALRWALRSIDFAFDCGATVVSLIPTRFGNGALESLAERGEFSPPKLSTLEAALDYGIGLERGRVFADLWDLERFSDCAACFGQRRARLREVNLHQVVRVPVECEQCRGGAM